jgi:lysophospholipase L1-like esterase
LIGTTRILRHTLLLLFGASFVTACGGPTSPQLGPVISCPASFTIQSPDGNALPVSFNGPTIVSGQPPFTTVCTPESGKNFLVGTSTVTCTVSDATQRASSCAFTITVVSPPRLTATSFMAFGNSITEGKDAFGPVANTYPVDLKALLVARYTVQAPTIAVVNKGFGGEHTSQGVARLPVELTNVKPQVLLIEEGINDLVSAASITPMVDNLRTMVREAKGRGIVVLLSTLTPVRAGGIPQPRGDAALPYVPEANLQIRLLAQSEHVTLVDLFAGFGGIPDPYIDVDGLHPTEQGYQKIAQLFFDVIRGTLETPQASAGVAGLP